MDMKEFAITTFEIAEWNLLKAIFRLKTEDLEKQIAPNLNPIRWAIGHLSIHMDNIFNGLCLGKRKFDQDFRDYFVASPDKRKLEEFPVSYMELIDNFLELSSITLNYLNNLPAEKFTELPPYTFENNTETIAESIQRISLHFLGHVGEIYQIRRFLSKGGTFVMGINKQNRERTHA